MSPISIKLPTLLTPAPARLAIGTGLLVTILTIETCVLFALRLAGTLQFNTLAFFDTGANLTVQYRVLGRLMEKYTLRIPCQRGSAGFSRVLRVRCDLTKERSLCAVA